MGSTGHSIYSKSKTGNVNTETFGIPNATNFTGKLPKNSGLEAVGNNKITLKVPVDKTTTILFQFKLNKEGDEMRISAFKDGIPEVKCKVDVSSGNPSLDKVIASGSKADKNAALKMKDLMSKSTEVSENQLSAIANKLLMHKKE